jgi:hypothetical protein
MKTLLLSTLSVLALVPSLPGQGTILFANDSKSVVTNGLTGQRVVAGTAFKAALYAGADGINDENRLLQAGESVGFFTAGLFNGGTRTVILPGGSYATVQVRIWETAYGGSYEEALAAGSVNGRTALVGKSGLLRVRLADSAGLPPEPPRRLSDYGLTHIVLTFSSVPSLWVNDIVVAEGTNGTKEALFTVTLHPSSQETVSVDYATADGTALAGADYIASSGTLVFAPGQTNKTISVTVTADVPPEPDEEFSLNLANAANVPIVRAQGVCIITEVRVAGLSIDTAVTFNTLANHRYIVEKSDDMISWTSVSGAEDVPGTGALVTTYDRGAGCQARRIYRARLLE